MAHNIPLYVAISKGEVEKVDVLIKEGGEENDVNQIYKGKSPLYTAICMYNIYKYIYIYKICFI